MRAKNYQLFIDFFFLKHIYNMNDNEKEINRYTELIKSELPLVWLIISDRDGMFVKLELLKYYLRQKKYKASKENQPIVTEKNVKVAPYEYLALLRTVYELGMKEYKMKQTFKLIKRAAKAEWEKTAKGTQLISPISPSPDSIIDLALSQININANDIFYDLGCGDGRWLCRATQLFKCKSIGLEIEENRLKLANENVKKNNLNDSIEIKNESVLTSDISNATVVLCYLFNEAMEQIGKTLRSRVKPGTKIIAVQFKLPNKPPQNWKPTKIYKPNVKNTRTIYYYII